MSVELTEEQRRALEARPEEPLRLIDPRTKQAYVLLRAGMYDRMRATLADEVPAADVYPLLAELHPDDWEDAARYDARSQE